MPHHYISTACQHHLHNRCRITCKFCPAACACTGCDHTTATAGHTEHHIGAAYLRLAATLISESAATATPNAPAAQYTTNTIVELLHRMADNAATGGTP